MIDIILGFRGIPEKITPYNKCTGLEGVTSEDFGMAMLEYPDGTSFVKVNARETCEHKTSPAFDRYDPMMSSFAQMVRGEEQNPRIYDYELLLHKCILRACGK